MKLRTRFPKKLGREPLLEGVWEMRFKGKQQAVSEVLTGLVFQQLRGDLERIERLATAALTEDMREQNKQLRYAPSTRLTGKRFAVNVGERALGLAALRPYCGWGDFKAKIDQLLGVVEPVDLIEAVESFSLKYVDCIAEPVPTTLASMALSVDIVGMELKAEPIHLRTEFTALELEHVLQISAPANVSVASTNEKLRGIVIDLDTHCRIRLNGAGNGFRQAIMQRLDQVHNANHALFFSLLTDDTLNALDPVY